MLGFDYKRWILAAAAIALPAAVLHAALPTDTDTSGRTSLAGELLIATPDMHEPFDHAVILMAQHNRDGALGIVINHPLDSRPIAGLLQALGGDASGITNSVRIFLGGPVDPNVAFVVHSADYHRDDTMDIDGRVALSDAADVLRDIGLGKGPSKSLVALGYAGWGAVAARRGDRARRLGHGAGRSGAGVRRRPGESVDRRAGAVEVRSLIMCAAESPPHSLIYSNRFLTPPC